MSATTPNTLEMIRRLIEVPSVSCLDPALDQSNRGVVDVLAEWLEPLGFDTQIQDIPDSDKCNLIASFGVTEHNAEEGLILAGHTDTVPFDADRWQSDPFTLTEKNGTLHGLGTCDMKAFLALAVEAARRSELKKLNRPLTILATADEETTMSGARLLAERGVPRARYAVIGEPTDMRPVRMHKGIMMHSVRLIGQAGHSSNPAYGNNALDGMYRVLTELMAFRTQLQEQYRNPGFSVPVPTLNFGHIHGGDNPNRICGACELRFDLRPLPGMQRPELEAEIQRRIARAVDGSGLQVELSSPFDGCDAMETPADSALVKSVESLTQSESEAVAFATEGPFLAGLGMDVVILGPGDIATAHQPGEHLRGDRIEPMVTLLEQLIDQFCAVAE